MKRETANVRARIQESGARRKAKYWRGSIVTAFPRGAAICYLALNRANNPLCAQILNFLNAGKFGLSKIEILTYLKTNSLNYISLDILNFINIYYLILFNIIFGPNLFRAFLNAPLWKIAPFSNASL